MSFLLLFIFVYSLLYLLVPKGVFLYELLRLPVWVYKMETYPSGNTEKVKYKYGSHFRQYLLYYKANPEVPQKKFAIIYIHGGGWQFGRPEMFRPNAQVLVERGYPVFMLSHRRLPFFDICKQREDVAQAVKKIRAVMESEGMGDKPLLLGGMSSGANLAGLLAFDRELLAGVGLSRDIFSGVFLLGAPVNLDGMWHSPPLWFLVGSRKGKRFKKASPIHFLEPYDDMPVFMLHAEKDGLVEFESAWKFYQEMKRLHFRNTWFYSLPGMTHTDAASWCFEGHASQKLLFDWLDDMENRYSLKGIFVTQY